MKENRFSCPKCNFWLNSAQMRRRGNPYFQCPSCGEKLRISPTYMRFLRYAGLLLAFAVPAILQIRDPLRFIGVALLAWFPVQVLFTTWLQFVHPPRITLYRSDSIDLSFRP